MGRNRQNSTVTQLANGMTPSSKKTIVLPSYQLLLGSPWKLRNNPCRTSLSNSYNKCVNAVACETYQKLAILVFNATFICRRMREWCFPSGLAQGLGFLVSYVGCENRVDNKLTEPLSVILSLLMQALILAGPWLSIRVVLLRTCSKPFKPSLLLGFRAAVHSLAWRWLQDKEQQQNMVRNNQVIQGPNAPLTPHKQPHPQRYFADSSRTV